MNIKNLSILEQGMKNIPQESFDMEAYRKDRYGLVTEFISPDNCGTIGCLLGHAPLIKGLEAIDSDNCKYGSILSFTTYCERVFDIVTGDEQWKFLFDANWSLYDKTLEGARKRLRYLIDGNTDLVNLLPYEDNFNIQKYKELVLSIELD